MQTILITHQDQQVAVGLCSLIDTGMALSDSFNSYTTCHKGMERNYMLCKGFILYATGYPIGTYYMLQWYGKGTYYMLQGCAKGAARVDTICIQGYGKDMARIFTIYYKGMATV